MRTDAKRMKKDIETLAQFTSTPGMGVTRLPFTVEDEKAKDTLSNKCWKLAYRYEKTVQAL